MTAQQVRAPNQYEVNDEAREEDVRWMHQHGENAIVAARRLGISPSGLHQWARRLERERPGCGILAVWQAMADRNPAALGVNQYDRGRWTR